MSIGIYAIFRKSDDKCMYVGQSKRLEGRLKKYFEPAGEYNNDEHYYKILETHDVNDNEYRLNREAFWINELNPERNICRNRKFNLTQEQIQKYSTKNTGKKRTPEQCERIRLSHIGQIAWNKGLTKETDKRVAGYAKTLSENKTGTHREYDEDGSYHFVK